MTSKSTEKPSYPQRRRFGGSQHGLPDRILTPEEKVEWRKKRGLRPIGNEWTLDRRFMQHASLRDLYERWVNLRAPISDIADMIGLTRKQLLAKWKGMGLPILHKRWRPTWRLHGRLYALRQATGLRYSEIAYLALSDITPERLQELFAEWGAGIHQRRASRAEEIRGLLLLGKQERRPKREEVIADAEDRVIGRTAPRFSRRPRRFVTRRFVDGTEVPDHSGQPVASGPGLGDVTERLRGQAPGRPDSGLYKTGEPTTDHDQTEPGSVGP